MKVFLSTMLLGSALVAAITMFGDKPGQQFANRIADIRAQQAQIVNASMQTNASIESLRVNQHLRDILRHLPGTCAEARKLAHNAITTFSEDMVDSNLNDGLTLQMHELCPEAHLLHVYSMR